MLGLYVHIPFCNQVCPYCDFFKIVASKERKKMFVDALLAEMKLKNLHNYQFDTLYIGGGSPSSLEITMLEKILIRLDEVVNLALLKEFTIEVNPLEITEELIKLFVKYHVSRLSIGVQTLNPRLQKIISRPLTTELLQTKIAIVKKYGIANINLDLLYAIPSETWEEFSEDLEKITSFDVPHLSCYSLILEEHTIFYHQFQKKQLTLIDEKKEAKMYHHLCNFLKTQKFIHYETSNFARKGYESIHNLIYWNCDEYVALGPGASSYLDNYRFKTISNLQSYFEGLKNQTIILEEKIKITNKEKQKEAIMLGLRKCQGLSLTKFFEDFNVSIFEVFPAINQLLEEKLLKIKGDYLFIPNKYFYISNYIINKII